MTLKKLLVGAICAGFALNSGFCIRGIDPLITSDIDTPLLTEKDITDMYSNFKKGIIRIPYENESLLDVFLKKLDDLESTVKDCLIQGVEGIKKGHEMEEYITNKFGIYRIDARTICVKNSEISALWKRCQIGCGYLKKSGWKIITGDDILQQLPACCKKKTVRWTVWQKPVEEPT
jgi:hypothetical protein